MTINDIMNRQRPLCERLNIARITQFSHIIGVRGWGKK